MCETAILILTYNGINDTLECLDSLKHQTYSDYDIIIIDNISSDNTVETIKSRYPHVMLIENSENLGYAGGNNVGLSYCLQKDYRYIFIINNDITLEPDTLMLLTGYCNKNEDVGIAGPVNYSYFNKTEILFLYSRLLENKFEFRVYTQPEAEKKVYETDYVNGAAMLVRTDAIRKIGLFDQNYFLFWEESDLCLRARRHGYKCVVLAEPVIYHKESASFGDTNVSPLKIYYLQRNKLYFFVKNFNKKRNLIFLLYCLDRSVKQLAKCLLFKPKSFTGLLRAIYYAYMDFARKIFGNRNDIIYKTTLSK